jgi:hypothetical protein
MTGHFNYSVQVINKDGQLILVDPFQITDGPVSMVHCGEVYPNNGKEMAPFYTTPFQSLTITWRIPASGAMGRAQVQMKIPKEFTQKMASRINFYIYPVEQRVEITYDILDPKTGQEKTIRQ